MPHPDVPSALATPLSRAEKEKLLQKMYSLPHWLAIIRLFGYQDVPMEQAREEIKPVATEFGKEKVADACEVLVEIVPGKEPIARLKSHIRRMAFQILGPEPSPAATAPATSTSDSKTEPDQPRSPRKRKSKKSAVPPAPTAEDAVPASADTRSPIMEQYEAAKEKHPDMLLLFRIGDFYELFGEDAETAHRLLGLTLTTRDRTVTMAGFPHHQLETYLHKLLKEGQRVAVCEPVDDTLARGPIRREVTRVVTPGTDDEDDSPDAPKRLLARETPEGGGRPLKQPRHLVLNRYQAWLGERGHAYVAVADVSRTTPAVKPFITGLDFIVLRDETKLLVTVRPHLQAKHLQAIGELQKLFGPEYRPVRVWPTEGTDGWQWIEHAIDLAASKPS